MLAALLLAAPLARAAGGDAVTLPRALEPAGGSDWPHLRGPSYNGLSPETGLDASWGTPEKGTGLAPEWRIDLGQGYSGIIAVGAKLYTQAQSLSGQYVVCLDADTGKRLWRYRYEWPWEPDGQWPGPRATPTWRDGKVYFAGAFGTVGCLDAETGRHIWSVNVTEKLDGRGTEYGYSCSPLVEDGKVFLPVGGEGASVVALDARDGSVVWQTGSEQASYSSAYPITVGGHRQIVVFLRNVLAGFDPATGRPLWEDRWSQGYDEHAAWPVYEEPYLLACAAFRGGARVLDLRGSSPSPAEAGGLPRLAWQSKELSNDIASSLILKGHIYGFDLRDYQPWGVRPARGWFKCIELATGKVRWSTDRTGHATAIAADGKLILLTEGGQLILVRATPEKYDELVRAWVFPGEHDLWWTPPSLSRGRLFLRNQKQATCFYLRDKKLFPTQVPNETRCWPEEPGLLDDLLRPWQGPSLYAPTFRDMARWYRACLPVFVGASGIALVLWILARRARPRLARWTGRSLFYVLLFGLGGLGTFALSPLFGRFLFTWPVSLFVAYQLALMIAAWARKGGRGAAWTARGVGLGFVGLCYLYYLACTSLFVVVGLGFLVGLLPAFPVAAWAAGRIVSRDRFLAEIGWTAVSFSVYFWASALFTVWKT